MSLRFLQNYPHLLEVAYAGFERLLQPFRRWLRHDGRLAGLFTWGEEIGKRALFDCQMCGQCILHSTGMTCSMTCPKNLRNGPCGGVRADGHCEVKPEMPCIWVQAYERSLKMPAYGYEMLHIQPPVNRQLQDTSAWLNKLHGLDSDNPQGWIDMTDISIITPEQAQKEIAQWTQISNQAAA